ncbi:MAG: hypothetical protein IJ264_03700, partial [Clostridia bacterium]|nr:hypothetical protein [Clostridia bacterium]
HLIYGFKLLDAESNHFYYGDKFRFRMDWHCSNATDRIKMKIIVSGSDTEGVGVIYAGDLQHSEGKNQTEFLFDTKYFMPGRYTLHFKLYDEDYVGNAAYYDQCTGIRFNVEHNDKDIHLKHWFKDWGNAVLPCIEQIHGDDKNV